MLLNRFYNSAREFARGIPIGTSLEFLDEVTLAHSIKDRVEIK